MSAKFRMEIESAERRYNVSTSLSRDDDIIDRVDVDGL